MHSHEWRGISGVCKRRRTGQCIGTGRRADEKRKAPLYSHTKCKQNALFRISISIPIPPFNRGYAGTPQRHTAPPTLSSCPNCCILSTGSISLMHACARTIVPVATMNGRPAATLRRREKSGAKVSGWVCVTADGVRANKTTAWSRACRSLQVLYPTLISFLF